MQVFIYDVDYLAKATPNFLAMRISSYHKQSGDTVTLLRPKDRLPKKLDLLYILQRDDELPHPPLSILMSRTSRIHGIQYFDNWRPPAALLACRPDYLLYPRGKSKYERSDAVQLTDERGHLLPVRQDDKNVETNKDTVITDENLWQLSNADLCKALTSIKDRKNIYFLNPIPLSRVLDDTLVTEAFLNLKMAQTVKLNWINSYPFMRNKVKLVMDFFDAYKERHPHNMIGQLAFYPKPSSTDDMDNIKLGVEFLVWLKTRCWSIELMKLRTRLDSAYSHYYEILHNWSLQPHLSFFELIAQTPAKKLGMTIEEYYCHPEQWTDEMFRAGIELYHTVNTHKWVDDPGWARWQYQDKYYNPAHINWSALLRRELWY